MATSSKLVVTENMSANGVIEFLDPWFDPSEQDDELLEVMRQQMAAETALVLGRQTFEDFRAYWPLQSDDTTGITAHLNQVPKYVVSSSMADAEWKNTTILRGRVAEEVSALKRSESGEIGVTGSIRVVHSLIEADLVDEYRLFVYPAFTARGRSLMPADASSQTLTLAEVRPFPSGVALLTYIRN